MLLIWILWRLWWIFSYSVHLMKTSMTSLPTMWLISTHGQNWYVYVFEEKSHKWKEKLLDFCCIHVGFSDSILNHKCDLVFFVGVQHCDGHRWCADANLQRPKLPGHERGAKVRKCSNMYSGSQIEPERVRAREPERERARENKREREPEGDIRFGRAIGGCNRPFL